MTTPMTPDTSTARVEKLARDADLAAERGWCDDDIAPMLRDLAAERDRLESALQTERGKLEAADAANDALARDAARYKTWRRLALTWKPEGDPFPEAMMGARTDAEIDAALDAAIKGRE